MENKVYKIEETKSILEEELTQSLEQSQKLNEGDLKNSKDILLKIRKNLEAIISHISLEIRVIDKFYNPSFPGKNKS